MFFRPSSELRVWALSSDSSLFSMRMTCIEDHRGSQHLFQEEKSWCSCFLYNSRNIYVRFITKRVKNKQNTAVVSRNFLLKYPKQVITKSKLLKTILSFHKYTIPGNLGVCEPGRFRHDPVEERQWLCFIHARWLGSAVNINTQYSWTSERAYRSAAEIHDGVARPG